MLKKFFKQFKHGQKGFTLIELLVVIAILGVLAAVAIPNVGKFVKSGALAAANTEVATVQLAAAAYAADNQNDTTFTDATLAGVTGAADGCLLAPYLDKPLKGIYDFDRTGKLVGTPAYPAANTVPASGTLRWNTDGKQFEIMP